MEKKKLQFILQKDILPQNITETVPQEVCGRFYLLDEMMNCIREGNESHALRLMHERMASRIIGMQEKSVYDMQIDLIFLASVFGQLLREKGVETLYAERALYEVIRKCKGAETTEDCSRIAEEMICDFCRLGKRKADVQYSALVQKIIMEVDMDLTKPLTLSYFSEQLNVNHSYLSNLFHRETGCSLTEYVCEKRIEYAAHLLRTTNLPIKNVAERVGIQDVQYFSRLFKKKKNLTPRQHRENNR